MMNLVSIYSSLCNIKSHGIFNTNSILYQRGEKTLRICGIECSILLKYSGVDFCRNAWTFHILAPILISVHLILWINNQSLFQVLEPNKNNYR